VLVVEDELRMAALLRRGLEEDGYAVDVATTAGGGAAVTIELPVRASGTTTPHPALR
jgi:two-component system OmpR family response regulator